ncbi:hypothetical protein CEXT_341101 [Caerostris extrusa]|uniref:Uncharacterized protein n=1 Tax=Caerostris extrusa TaxID=172846 RepID=A0AAV4QD00_CAEEX|nr:hypothetical protein CEXT_341101 [Caerostris extrusa]
MLQERRGWQKGKANLPVPCSWPAGRAGGPHWVVALGADHTGHARRPRATTDGDDDDGWCRPLFEKAQQLPRQLRLALILGCLATPLPHRSASGEAPGVHLSTPAPEAHMADDLWEVQRRNGCLPLPLLF